MVQRRPRRQMVQRRLGRRRALQPLGCSGRGEGGVETVKGTTRGATNLSKERVRGVEGGEGMTTHWACVGVGSGGGCTERRTGLANARTDDRKERSTGGRDKKGEGVKNERAGDRGLRGETDGVPTPLRHHPPTYPPTPAPSPRRGARLLAHQSLSENLLFGEQWTAQHHIAGIRAESARTGVILVVFYSLGWPEGNGGRSSSSHLLNIELAVDA